jgi:hypothetical protein
MPNDKRRVIKNQKKKLSNVLTTFPAIMKLLIHTLADQCYIPYEYKYKVILIFGYHGKEETRIS